MVLEGDSDYSEPSDEVSDASENESYHSSEMGTEALAASTNDGISPKKKPKKNLYQ